jgi:hypothetical protein
MELDEGGKLNSCRNAQSISTHKRNLLTRTIKKDNTYSNFFMSIFLLTVRKLSRIIVFKLLLSLWGAPGLPRILANSPALASLAALRGDRLSPGPQSAQNCDLL